MGYKSRLPDPAGHDPAQNPKPDPTLEKKRLVPDVMKVTVITNISKFWLIMLEEKFNFGKIPDLCVQTIN